MKKYIHNLFIITISILAVNFSAKAAQVSVATAQTVALNFFKTNSANLNGRSIITADLKLTQTEADSTVDFYVFDINPSKGFVIVSADDNMTPVIAYSFEANFNSDFSHSGVSAWMNHASSHIHNAIQQNKIADARITNLWSSYAQDNAPGNAKSNVVTPLLSTTWGQQPYFNQFAPFNSADNQRCLTGCVATAMAQIMKFWNYPAQGTGSYSYNDALPAYSYNYGNQSANFGAANYNWKAMPNSLDSNNTDIATLMYHCGVSVSMDFGDDKQGGSGAHVLQAEVASWQHSAQFAYATYFSYDQNALQGVYAADYSSADWTALLESELNAGRPIQYQGTDNNAGGHTWVCDGFDANDMFHMNWGWNGNNNGYFSVSSLCVGSFNFSNDEAALIGIHPLSTFTATASASKTTLCMGDSSTLTAQGPATATYSWSPVAGLTCPTCASTRALPNTNTLYTVTVNNNGATATATVNITVNSSVQANVEAVNATCFGMANGSLTVAGANPSHTFIWNTGQTTASISDIPAGTYSVTVSNTAGCSAVAAASIIQPEPLSVSITTDTVSSVQAIANVSGGTMDYDFLWNGGETTALISNLSGGTYSVTVSDKNGCKQSASVIVENSARVATGVNAIAANTAFNAYPNPAMNEITVELNNLAGETILSLKNVLGQTMLTRTVSEMQNRIDLSSVSNGVYFIELSNGVKTSVQEIIVKK